MNRSEEVGIGPGDTFSPSAHLSFSRTKRASHWPPCRCLSDASHSTEQRQWGRGLRGGSSVIVLPAAPVPKRCLQLSSNSHRSWFVARSSSGPTPIAGSGARDRYGLALAAVSGKLAKYRRHLWRPPHFVPDSPGMAELAYSSKLRCEAVRRAGLGLRICCRTMGGARCSRMVPSVMAALCDVRARGRREGAPRCQPARATARPLLGMGAGALICRDRNEDRPG